MKLILHFWVHRSVSSVFLSVLHATLFCLLSTPLLSLSSELFFLPLSQNISKIYKSPCLSILLLFSSRFSPTCYRDDVDGDITCDACPRGYEGRRCQECAVGYEGQPTVPFQTCRPTNGEYKLAETCTSN